MDSPIDTGPEKVNMKLSLLASFKVTIVEYFLSTTSHALPNIFRTGNIILKIIWLLCFLTSASYCIASMSKVLKEYLTYPSYISTEIIKEVTTKFPAITFCNLKTVNMTKSENKMNLYGLNNSIYNPIYGPPLDYLTALKYITRTFINNDKTLTYNDRKEMGFQLKDMLISCSFNYRTCNESDFEYSYEPLYGNCYTFNNGLNGNGTIKKLSLAGTMYGLILELYLGDPKVDTKYELNDGLLISIHNQSIKQFTQGENIVAAAGAETFFSVSRNFISKLEYPYGDCLKDIKSSSTFNSFYFDYLVRKIGETYSQEHCYSLCFQKKIINKCNFTNSFMPTFNDTNHFCGAADGEIACLLDIVNNFGDTQAAVDCQTYCPYECVSVEYGVSTYKARYPSEFYTSLIYDKLKVNGINASTESIEKAAIKVNIYYKSMEYISTQQMIQTSTEDLFSIIGGTVGLYIGISLLSLVEIVELGFNLILALMAYLKSRKKVKNNFH
jgi:hypothetical protein